MARLDAFPEDATEQLDTDGDHIGKNAESDDDNDGWADADDDFPLDSSAFLDPALDRDGDSVVNGSDNCPMTANADQADTDANGEGDACANDADAVLDADDLFPLDATESSDLDGDNIGDNSDLDRDGDGVNNMAEALAGTNPDRYRC